MEKFNGDIYMKRCIVNVYSKGREDYETLSKGLLENIKTCGFIGDVLLFSPLIQEDSIEYFNDNKIYRFAGWPYCNSHGISLPHIEANHQFKSFAIQRAREMGYEQVLWLDSPIRIKKNPMRYFDIVEDIGVLLFDAEQGAEESKYTSDICLEYLGCSPEYGMTFNQCSSGVMVFDFTTKIANKIQDEFIYYCSIPLILDMSKGSTRPEFIAHRSDQSIITFLLKKYGLGNLPYGGYMYSSTYKIYNEKFGVSPTFTNR